MKKRYFNPEQDGFYGVYYPNPKGSKKAIICMLGDSSDDYMARSGAKWIIKQGLNALCMSPDAKDYGHHNYPLERFYAAIKFLKSEGNEKIGITGASTTGMLALVVASYYTDISLTLAFTPSDFVMEGFYQGKRDGCYEWPGEEESSVSWKGEPLPYLPYCYRHPQYWREVIKDSRESKNMVASRKMFDRSEKLHPVQEAEKIKVEKIQGKLLLIGAEDDVLWDTAKYIRRMRKRLASHPHNSKVESVIYKYGTHFVFPQSMMKQMLPVGSSFFVALAFQSGRTHLRACKRTRIDIDKRVKKAILEW